MRKPRQLPEAEVMPYVVQLPGTHPRQPPTPEQDQLPPVPINWATLFGNTNPVEMEVGFGKGMFLVNAGIQQPDTNFFGIEIERKYQMYAANRVALRGLANVRTCCADAKAVLQKYVTPGSLSAMHVYFPDPWWKSKHKKRLLFTAEFTQLILRSLKLHGIFHFVTDVKDYFAMASELMVQVPEFELRPPRPATTVEHDLDYLTNFERKFRKEGRPIYRSAYEKVANTQ